MSVRIALTPDSATPFELFWSSSYWAWWIYPQYKLGSVVGIEEISGIRKEKGLLELLHLQGIDDKSTDLGQTFFYSFIIHGWNLGRDVPGGRWTLGVTLGEDGVGDNKDTRMIFLPFFCFFALFCRFFLFPLPLLHFSWNGRTIWPHVFFLHVYAAHGIDETNMELMLRNPPFLLLFLTF